MAKGAKMKVKNIALTLIGLSASISMFAQEAAAAATTTATTGNIVITPREIIVNSGKFAPFIIATFVIGLVMFVSRFRFLYVKEKLDASQFFIKLRGFIQNEQLDEATKISESFKNTTLGFIFWSGLKVFQDVKKSNRTGNSAREAVQNAFDEATLQKVYKLEEGLFWFDTLAQIATYLGLLGTIWGLMQAFKGMTLGAASEQQKQLTIGINKAIGTTAMGLIAALPLTVFKGFLQTRSAKISNDIDEFSVKMINRLNNLIKD